MSLLKEKDRIFLERMKYMMKFSYIWFLCGWSAILASLGELISGLYAGDFSQIWFALLLCAFGGVLLEHIRTAKRLITILERDGLVFKK